MSRLKTFSRSLFSGYILLATNIIYTFISVPLAFKYLPDKAELGLWFLTSQIAGYLALLDLGMNGVSRILIDYKDRKDNSDYGSVILTSAMVSAIQGMLTLACSVAAGFWLADVLEVPGKLGTQFTILAIGQGALLFVTYMTRIFSFLLTAHQRYDVLNLTQSLVFLVNLGVLWICFASRMGVYSFLASQAAGALVSAVIPVVVCSRLKLFPQTGCWGRPSPTRFLEIFALGRDIFLFSVGGLLINASQTILITKWLGLEAATIWSVCTRTYLMIAQVVYRIFDYSTAALAEMIVRGENERLYARFKSLSILSCSLSVVLALLFAVYNQPFVHWWSGANAGWASMNDWLLALWLVISVCARCHIGLVGQTKNFRFLRYLYFVEGLVFVGLSFVGFRIMGITGLIVSAIVSDLLFSLPYGIARTTKYFGKPWQEIAFGWFRRPFTVVLLMILPTGAVWALSIKWPSFLLATIEVAGLSLFGLWLLLRFGLDEATRLEVLQRIPNRIRPWLLRA